MEPLVREVMVLSDDECRDLLARHHFGRIAVVADGRPRIFPVNYVFAAGRIGIRTDPGTKLRAADLAHVAFEIDGVDVDSRLGWSVVVQGHGYDITDAIDEVSEMVRRLPVEPWVEGDKSHWIRIEAREVSGRILR